MISHKCQFNILVNLGTKTYLLCTFFIKPFLALLTRPLTVQSCTALAVLFPDYQKLTYVKQQNVSLPLCENLFCDTVYDLRPSILTL